MVVPNIHSGPVANTRYVFLLSYESQTHQVLTESVDRVLGPTPAAVVHSRGDTNRLESETTVTSHRNSAIMSVRPKNTPKRKVRHNPWKEKTADESKPHGVLGLVATREQVRAITWARLPMALIRASEMALTSCSISPKDTDAYD